MQDYLIVAIVDGFPIEKRQRHTGIDAYHVVGLSLVFDTQREAEVCVMQRKVRRELAEQRERRLRSFFDTQQQETT